MPESRTDRFDRLVAPHLDTLLRVAFRLVRNAPDAEDLVQDTCIAACEHPADVDAATQPVHWLLRVLHNRFLDRTRQQRRRPQVPIDDADRETPLVCGAPGPEEILLRSESERALEAAYLKLEDMQRTLLVLRTEGYGLSEIEAITGIQKEVLRARLHRARRSLARHLQRGEESAPLMLNARRRT